LLLLPLLLYMSIFTSVVEIILPEEAFPAGDRLLYGDSITCYNPINLTHKYFDGQPQKLHQNAFQLFA
jgi:hypothetical protein